MLGWCHREDVKITQEWAERLVQFFGDVSSIAAAAERIAEEMALISKVEGSSWFVVIPDTGVVRRVCLDCSREQRQGNPEWIDVSDHPGCPRCRAKEARSMSMADEVASGQTKVEASDASA